MRDKGNASLESRLQTGPQDSVFLTNPSSMAAPRGNPGTTPTQRRTRLLALGLTLAAHALVLTALFWPRTLPAPRPPEQAPLRISLLPTPPAPSSAANAHAEPQNFIQPTLPHAALPVVAVAMTPAPDNSDLLSDSQLAGAARAGEGGPGGGGCDTARAVQQALRRDPLVRTAVENAHRQGKAVMVWNGDWVRTGGQDGKGLSAVREAIAWQIAFAPAACRNERLHGLVLLSLADGGTRFAIGSGDWRWSDLLGLHGATR